MTPKRRVTIACCVLAAASLLVMPTGPARATRKVLLSGVPDWLISTDFPSIQSAIDNLPSNGGVVYVPSGRWAQDSVIRFPLSKPVRLLGAGWGSTVLQWTNTPSGTDSYYVACRGSNQSIEGLSIVGNNTAGTTRGVFVLPAGVDVLKYFTMRDCRLDSIPGWAVEAYGNAVKLSILSRIERCRLDHIKSRGGISINSGCTTWTITNCDIGPTDGVQLYMDHVASSQVIASAFETDLRRPLVRINNSQSIALHQCYFESHATQRDSFLVELTGTNNQGITVSDGYFSRDSAQSAKILNAASPNVVYGLVVSNPTIVLNGITGQPTGADDIAVTAGQSTFSVLGGSIGNANGFWLPRVTDTASRTFLGNYNERLRMPKLISQTIAGLSDVKAGDMIFTPDSTLLYYNGLKWKVLDSHDY